MSIYFNFEPTSLLILPLLGIQLGECENPDCKTQHWMVTIGWLVWSLDFVFECGGEV